MTTPRLARPASGAAQILLDAMEQWRDDADVASDVDDHWKRYRQSHDAEASRLSDDLDRFCAQGDALAARALIDARPGLLLDAHASDFKIPLHTAASLGRLDCAELLLSRGARVDARDRKGFAALDKVGRRSPTPFDADMVRLLARHGAALLRRAPDALTPFMRACENLDLDSARALDELGAGVGAHRAHGKKSLDLARAAWSERQARSYERDDLDPPLVAWLRSAMERRALGDAAGAGSGAKARSRSL